MAVGSGSVFAGLGYLSVGRETAYGTGVTATAALCPLSISLKTSIERKVLEEISYSRTYQQGLSMSKVVQGDVEFYAYPRQAALAYIMQNCMGGSLTTATVSTSVAFIHTFKTGDVDTNSYTSLTISQRKGETSTGKVFEYHGTRVNELSFVAEIDEPIKCIASLIAQDSTIGATSWDGSLGVNSTTVMSFVDARVSFESTFASLTSTSFWHVQSCTFKVSNNLKADVESRRLGSNTLAVLPQGMQTFEFTTSIRFDTSTAFDAMISETQYSAQIEFLGDTLASATTRQGIKINLPKVFVLDAGDPEIDGPDGILTSEVTWQVLQDVTSATGYACQMELTNGTSSYE